MQAHLKKYRISPKKANIIAGLIRNKKALEALEMLRFIPNKAAQPLWKTLNSAVSNAVQNNGHAAESLIIEKVIVNKSYSLRRHLPSARGRALPLRKPMSNISIFLATQ